MSTSIYKGSIRFDATDHDDDETLSVDLARTVVNNVLHAADQCAQVRVAIPPSKDQDGFPTLQFGLALASTEARLMARIGPFPLNIGADGRAYPCRIRLAAANTAGSATNKIIAYLHPFRAFSLEGAAQAVFTCDSTTTAWIEAEGDRLIWPSASQTAAALESLYTLDAVSGNPVSAEWAYFMLSIYGQRASGSADVYLNGLYLAEYCGYEYDPLRDLPSLAHAYEAGSWTLDSSNNVSSWTDLVGDEDLDQATTADMPLGTWNNSNFDDRATVDFDDANTEFLQAQTAGAWNFMHNGTEWTALVVMRIDNATSGNETVWDTNNQDQNNSGAFLRVDNTDLPRVLINNGTGTNYAAAVGSAGQVDTGSVITYVVRYSSDAAEGLEVIQDDTVLASDTSYTGSASAGDAFDPLTVGKRSTSNARYLDASVSAMYFCSQRLTDAELDNFQAWATAKYGA